MSNFPDSASSKSIDQREHNTDASAKRVVQYYQDGNGDWLQTANALVAGVDYDYLSVSNTNTDEDTLIYKTGGSGGTTVLTLVVTYASGAEKISDSFSVLTWS